MTESNWFYTILSGAIAFVVVRYVIVELIIRVCGKFMGDVYNEETEEDD